MDFSSQNPESPARPLAGAARSRVLARQQRSSAQKPYNRSELAKSGSSGSLHALEDGFVVPSTPTAKASSSSASGPFTPFRVAASPFALLGSVTKMVSKPLSWLTRSVVASQPELGIPTSSSTGSLSSMARKRAAAQALQASHEVGENPSALAARAVGERLAAGLRSRPAPPRDDEESQLRPQASNLVTDSASTFRPHAAKSSLASTSARPVNTLPATSSLTRSFTFSDKLDTGRPTTWSNRASKRTLDIGSPGPNASLDTFSDNGRAASPLTNLRSPRSQLSLHRSSSLRPDDAMSESGSVLSHSNSSYAFGYGNEVRYTNNSFGLPPSSSPFQLASRSGVRRARSSLGPALFSDPATPRKSPHSSQLGLRGASPAASVASRAREGTPQRRNWNGLNLTAPSAPSIGDDMMKAYLSTRALPPVDTVPLRALGHDMLVSSPARSAVAGSVMDESDVYTPGRLGKRDIDMSVDGDSERIATAGTPSKRRMVWHPEMGFISHEELKAREPKLPSPKNEAERLLNVLENMRAAKSKTAPGPSRGPPPTIHVPTPTSEPVAQKASIRSSGKTSVHVAPYSRAVKKAKEAQTTPDAQAGMRSRLRKVQPSEYSTIAMEEDDDHMEEVSVQKTAQEVDGFVSEEEEPEPKPEPVRRSRRLQHRDPEAKPEVATPIKATGTPKQDSQLKSALKATPLKAASPAVPDTPVAIETPKPSSHRISLAAAHKVPSSTTKKDNFAIKASTADPSGPRGKSTLRQGAAKTSRTHQSSGKFSAWDEDEEDEDLPDATELAKIKIPANMFPTGFTFGAADSSKPEAPKQAESQPSSGSLLGRLGGFDTTNDASQDKPAERPSFSFSAPTNAAASSAPKFTFGASTTPVATDKKEADKAKAQLPPSSDFFSKPSESNSSSITEAKNDGPVPNFFGSTMQKFDNHDLNTKPATTSTSSGFSFGSTSIQPNTAANVPNPSSGNSFKASSEAKKDAPAASKPSFFGNAAGAAPSSGAFSFGAPSASSSLKRSTEDKDEPDAKKIAPTFSFGGSASSPAPKIDPPASTGGFSFGAPKASDTSTEKDSSVPKFFGAKGETPASTTGGFNFGKATNEQNTTPSGGFSFSKPEAPSSTSSSSGGFSFSKPADDTSKSANSGFSFGTPSSTAATSEAKTTSTTPSFSFGPSTAAPKDAAPAPSVPSISTTAPSTTFTFGAPSSASTTATSQPAAGGFSFGSSSGAGTTGGFGGFGGISGKASLPDKPNTGSGNGEMMDDAPQPSSSTPKFSFGDSVSSTTPSASASPAPFTFGAPPSSGAAAGPSAPAPSSFGSAPSTSFTFGSSAPASGSLTPSGPPPTGGFRFGSPAPTSAPASNSAPSFTFGGGVTTPGQANSTPASPFLAPQQAPPTPGGSPFQFGASQPTASSSTPFQFGAGAPAAPSSTGFSFGAPAATNPTSSFGGFGGGTPPPSAGPTNTSFSFGAGLPTMPSMPSMPGTPGAAAPGGGMFSIGAAPTPNANNSPGARQIKPLRLAKRRPG